MNEIIYRSWVAFHGVGPTTVISFLRAAKPGAAKGMTDNALQKMIIFMKRQYQNGEDQ